MGEVAGLGHNIVALCDVDENYAAKEFAKYPKAKQFKDYRVMLDKMGKEIDGVVIGTPDHTHAVIAMEAMRHGKHVYCEKPLAHSVHEVRELMAAGRTNTRLSRNSATRVIPAVPFAGFANGFGPAPSGRFTPFMPAATLSRMSIARSPTCPSGRAS